MLQKPSTCLCMQRLCTSLRAALDCRGVSCLRRCPFCVKAKKELPSMGAKFTAVALADLADGAAIRYELAKVHSHLWACTRRGVSSSCA